MFFRRRKKKREKLSDIALEVEEKKPLEISDEISEKIENPVCPKCKKHMKSKGKDQGFKCKICGIKSNAALVREKKRDIGLGFYEVPVCARRHLSKPLKRMGVDNYLNRNSSAILYSSIVSVCPSIVMMCPEQ